MGLQLGADTVRLGAFRPCQGMTNDGAVAVIQARPAVAAVRAHGPFISSGADKSGLPRPGAGSSRPAQLVQALVVDAEVMGDLMDHRDGDLVDDLILRVAGVQQRLAVDRDGIRQRSGVVGAALG